MYASPAYGTHQVFTEPGQHHLYELIDGLHKEEATKLQDTASPANDDNEIDTEGYLKMKPSCEVVDQTLTESSVVADTYSTFVGSKSTDDYVQALGNNLYVHSLRVMTVGMMVIRIIRVPIKMMVNMIVKVMVRIMRVMIKMIMIRMMMLKSIRVVIRMIMTRIT